VHVARDVSMDSSPCYSGNGAIPLRLFEVIAVLVWLLVIVSAQTVCACLIDCRVVFGTILGVSASKRLYPLSSMMRGTFAGTQCQTPVAHDQVTRYAPGR